MKTILFACALSFPIASGLVTAQVVSEYKISDTSGGFAGGLTSPSHFGADVTAIGDLNGDGRVELAVGAPFTNGGDLAEGAVWVLFLDEGGAVESELQIGEGQGGFGDTLAQNDFFGDALASPGDIDGDGIPDLLVGSPGDDDGAVDAGSIRLLFLNTNGTVRSQQKISATAGGLTLTPAAADNFGAALAWLGDLDGDGAQEIAVGAQGTIGSFKRGYSIILEIDSSGIVQGEVMIGNGSISNSIESGDRFGSSVAHISDLDGDGIDDLVVGSAEQLSRTGHIDIIFLNSDGTPKDSQRISNSLGGLGNVLVPGAAFGSSLTSPGDLDSNGIPDLLVGARRDGSGVCWILLMDPSGRVRGKLSIGSNTGCFGGSLDDLDDFASSLAWAGDLNGDGLNEVLIGAQLDDDLVVGCPLSFPCDTGAVWVVTLPDSVVGLAVHRNGAGGNAISYQSPSGPVIGQTWTATVDASVHPGALLSIIVAYASPLANVHTAFGELLVDPTSPFGFSDQVPVAGSMSTHLLAVPNDACLIGTTFASQAVVTGGGIELANAIDLTIGI
jgi:hypothetical protein